jgi:hypothetical protein
MRAARQNGVMTYPFEQLDFLYTPSNDVAADMAYYEKTLGARIVFAIDSGDTRVAMIDLTGSSPHLLLADHLEGERPIYVYRVADLETALDELAGRGWKKEHTFEIPQGPCCSFTTPGGHRLALYQVTRPDVGKKFEGRRDF